MKKNYRLIFNILLISGISFFFASCAREKGTISYNSEKLRKQSIELEKSQPSRENIVATNEDHSTAPKEETKSETRIAENNIVTNNPSIGENVQAKKISGAQKLIAKKIVKKMNLESQSAKGGLDPKLKMAIIFGAIGLIFFILDFVPFFWILGAVALVIAIVFLLMWVLEQ